MEYIQVARELASIVPTAREAYRDMLWLYGVARATWTPAASSAPEVEMVACFRECVPLEHEAEVWSTESVNMTVKSGFTVVSRKLLRRTAMHHVPDINTLQGFLNFAHAHPLTQRCQSHSLKVFLAGPRRKYPS